MECLICASLRQKPNPPRAIAARGLCKPHYSHTVYNIKTGFGKASGDTWTWARRVDLGFALPSVRGRSDTMKPLKPYVPRLAKDRPTTRRVFEKCMTPICELEASRRGLCDTCYKKAWRKVRNGHDTWDKLFYRGKVEQVQVQRDDMKTRFNTPNWGGKYGKHPSTRRPKAKPDKLMI